MAKITKHIARSVQERANGCCEYCRSSEWLTGQRFHIDHIVPQSKGGSDELDNLCLACPGCNGSKLNRLLAFDSESGENVPLFHPRLQQWLAHFIWDAHGTHILRITATGRATVVALKMNRSLSVAVRSEWVRINRHPPEE